MRAIGLSWQPCRSRLLSLSTALSHLAALSLPGQGQKPAPCIIQPVTVTGSPQLSVSSVPDVTVYQLYAPLAAAGPTTLHLQSPTPGVSQYVQVYTVMYQLVRYYSTGLYVLACTFAEKLFTCTYSNILFEKSTYQYIPISTTFGILRYIPVYTVTYWYMAVQQWYIQQYAAVHTSTYQYMAVHHWYIQVRSSTSRYITVYASMRFFHSSTLYMRVHPLFTCFVPAATAPCWAGAELLES